MKSMKVPFKMLFVGEGYACKDMKKMVKQTQLTDQVKFLGLITDRDELRYVYALADLFVFPSLYDNSPLVIQEAAAYDVPSIMVRGSSSAEGITDKVNGFLIENSSEALASLVMEIMKYPEVIRLAGEGARKSIYRNWEFIADDVYHRYLEIINNYKPRSIKPADDDEDLD